MTLRVFWRSFSEPFASAPSASLLIVSMLLLWFIGGLLVLAGGFSVDGLGRLIAICMALPVTVLALPLISGEAKDGTLLLALMQPVSRVNYYTGRVLGRAAVALVYFFSVMAGLYLVLRQIEEIDLPWGRSGWIFMPAGALTALVVTGLTYVSVILSLAALAPLSSSRYGHLFYWALLCLLAEEAAAFSEADVKLHAVSAILVYPMVEIVRPFLLGPSSDFVWAAPLGNWYLLRALAQWGFGACLAYAVGLYTFSRMEVGINQ